MFCYNTWLGDFMEYLDLPLIGKRNLSINARYFSDIKDELEEFLVDEDEINSRKFVKKIMFNQEIKSNNTIEGINDDLMLIEKVIRDASSIKDVLQRKRIINLYHGYKYILSHRVIDESHLKELYGILSDGLIEDRDLANIGQVYREAPVYILKKGRLDTELDQGLPYEMVPEYMKIYFDYVNNGFEGTITDQFIKSQIMHFYFVYIHPYFDANGRTSRTLAMWYLLNSKAYPYIIFNRAITNNGDSGYDESIINAKNSADISFFIKYMMINVKRELEKEIIMSEIKNNTSYKMDAMNFQTLNYILSMNGEINVLNFATMYRRNNNYKKVQDIYEESLQPLKDMGIIYVVRQTKKMMFLDYPNEVFKINPSRFDRNNPKIRRLDLCNK